MKLRLPNGPRPPLPLSPRERQVADLIRDGLRTKEIAVRLGVTVDTVEAHRYNLMLKLDAHNVAQVILALAARDGAEEARIRLAA